LQVARIDEGELARLKAEVSLVGLVEAKGIALAKHGAGGDLVACCPFHEDRSPSFVVSPSKNLWRCHGACQAGGSVVDFVMRIEGVSFRHAVDLLRQGVPVGPVDGLPPKRSTSVKLPPLAEPSVEDRELLGRVVGFYADTLTESADALGYLARRRIDNAEAIETFKLGYANRTLGYRLPHSTSVAGAELRGRLQRLGVIRESGHEHFRGSLVVPVVNAGEVLEVYGRKLLDNLRAGTPKHLYLPGPHKGVWNLDAFTAGDEVIVCESLIDALSLWCWGFRHVTAAYGVEGFTADHWAAIDQHRTRRVLLAFDADEAGDKAARRLARQLLDRGVEVFRVGLPAGSDVNDVVRNAKQPTDELGRLLRRAAWMGAGVAPDRRTPSPSAADIDEPGTTSPPPGSPRPGPVTCSATPWPHSCSKAVPTFATSNRCSATPTSPLPRSTPTSRSGTSKQSTLRPTPPHRTPRERHDRFTPSTDHPAMTVAHCRRKRCCLLSSLKTMKRTAHPPDRAATRPSTSTTATSAPSSADQPIGSSRPTRSEAQGRQHKHQPTPRPQRLRRLLAPRCARCTAALAQGLGCHQRCVPDSAAHQVAIDPHRVLPGGERLRRVTLRSHS